MNLLGPVSDVMTSSPFTLTPSATIGEAALIFEEHKVHHIPIAIEGKLVGMVSMTDYLFFRRGFLDDRDDHRIEDIRMNNYEVRYIMTKRLATLNSTDRITVALHIFSENLFHALPVVDNYKLVGILTTHDIISRLAKDNDAYAEYD